MTYVSTYTTARPVRGGRHNIGLGRIIDMWRSRQHLKRLDDRALADVGLSSKDALTEANRPIWDVPATWRD